MNNSCSASLEALKDRATQLKSVQRRIHVYSLEAQKLQEEISLITQTLLCNEK